VRASVQAEAAPPAPPPFDPLGGYTPEAVLRLLGEPAADLLKRFLQTGAAKEIPDVKDIWERLDFTLNPRAVSFGGVVNARCVATLLPSPFPSGVRIDPISGRISLQARA
jgi:hypothetical protein